MNEAETTHLVVKLPHDVRSWLQEQAKRNVSSLRAEIVLAVRAKMEREAVRG